ncbi:putative protein kinase [Trypoxylus dichotomus]
MSSYAYLSELGRGTFGTVYLCEKKHNKMKIVIKEIELNSDQLTIAQNEVNILKTLHHPNICQYYDSFKRNNKFSIVMEYARFGNLHDYLKNRRLYNDFLHRDLALNIICQVLLGLEHLHSKKIIHRDLKTENIFLSGSMKDFIKIGDFGISKCLRNNDQANTIIGTTNYLAPEMCDGQPYDMKSDIWSFGCIMYEVCSLERLFNGTISEVVTAIKSGQRKQIDLEHYGADIQEVIEMTTQIDPVLRPTTRNLMANPVFVSKLYFISVNLGQIWNCK